MIDDVPDAMPPVTVDQEGQEHVRPAETRGASKEGVVRWVLVASLLLVIVGMSIIWITGALSTG